MDARKVDVVVIGSGPGGEGAAMKAVNAPTTAMIIITSGDSTNIGERRVTK